MASLTIRDIDDSLKQDLRLRAAQHSRSMEEEVRQILQTALRGPAPEDNYNLATRIRARFADMGGVELEIAPREMGRDPPNFDDPAFDLPARVAPKEQKPTSAVRKAATRASNQAATKAGLASSKPPLARR